jgi:hypothetical protein
MIESQNFNVSEVGQTSLPNKELTAQLKIAEESLQRYERAAIAGRYAGAVMHEVNNPREALGDPVHLTI